MGCVDIYEKITSKCLPKLVDLALKNCVLVKLMIKLKLSLKRLV